MRLRRAVFATVIAVALVGSMSSCRVLPGEDSQAVGAVSAVPEYQQQHRGGTLRVLARASAGSLDPQVNYTPQYWQLFPALYDGLVGFAQVSGPQSLQVVPDLATELPRVADDGRTYVFTLRRDVRFSTGATVSPEDVVASLRRIFTVRAPTAASTYAGIVGADVCLATPARCTLDGGAVADAAAGTVTIHLVAPDPDFLLKLAIPPAAVLPAGTPAAGAGALPPPGTGAYQVTSYRPAESVVLDRNPHFTEWSRVAQPAGYPDRIVEEFGQDPAKARAAVAAGEADVRYDEPPAAARKELAAGASGQVHTQPLAGLWYLAMNVRTAPFDQVKARQAVNWAVDRAAAARAFGGEGGATPACTVLPAGFPGHRDECVYTSPPAPTWQGADLVRARQFVTESGTAGQRVRLLVADDATSRTVGDTVAAALGAIGYRASVRALPADLYYRYVQDPGNGAQISLANWFPDYPSPAAFLGVLLGCPESGPTSQNLSQYCDRTIQTRLDQAATVTDRKAAADAWADLDHDLMTAAPIAPLFTPTHVDVLSPKAGNYQWSQQYRLILSQVWVR